MKTELEKQQEAEIKLLRSQLDETRSQLVHYRNFGTKWSRNWQEWYDDDKDLFDAINNLTYHELLEFISFSLIRNIVEAHKKGYMIETNLGNQYIKAIQASYYAVQELKRDGIFTGLAALAWNNVTKELDRKYLSLVEQREQKRAEVAENIRSMPEDKRSEAEQGFLDRFDKQQEKRQSETDKVWQQNLRKETQVPYIEEEE